MTEKEIKQKVNKLKKLVDEVNTVMADLDAEQVEVRIAYNERKQSTPPSITLWKLTQHVDFL